MTATFYVGDAVSVMNRLPEKSVDLILTSPPFLALRSYLPSDHPDKALEGGSQATPGAFIDWLIDVVEACDRVLAPHGSLCVELGDTYAGSGGAGGDYGENGPREGEPMWGGSSMARRQSRKGYGGAANRLDGESSKKGSGWPLAKSLSLIPELFRLTLVYGFNPLTGRQTERWRLRNVVRWVRPNPPVGALGDKFRPATSELMVFCKSAKRFFDLDAVRLVNNPERMDESSMHNVKSLDAAADNLASAKGNGDWNPAGAPPLDWWNIPPGGYQGAHYAVFPPELCIKPIKAMCPERVCRQCGEPSRRIVESTPFNLLGGQHGGRHQGNNGGSAVKGGSTRYGTSTAFLGWSDCGHGTTISTKRLKPIYVEDHWRPGLVLDPFAGSGTTGLVATGHGRDAILIDLDERNYDLALDRVGPLVLSKGEVAA